MATLQEKLKEQIPPLREDLKNLVKEHGDKVISEVTVAQAFGGMRGVKSLICDTSFVDPEKGLIIRDIPILDLTDKLPEDVFYLLVTGEIPDEAASKALQNDLKARQEVPQYIWDVLKAMPSDSHPMAMLDAAIMVLERESVYRKKYDEGIPKTDYWIYTVEDTLQLLAKLPGIAAGVYRMRFNKGDIIPADPNLDWGGNYAHMLGIDDPDGEFKNLMRLYLTLHSDHESGNVSAFTCHTVGSALSDIYYAVSAGLNGLAGPLHGLANQECLKFVLEIIDKYNGVPTKEQLIEYAWETLNSGKVIPGYGHAVLRKTDPRFTAFNNFGLKVCPESPAFKVVNMMFENIPDVLIEHGKAKSPWPNVDAGSGALLHHFGMTEFSYYTVLFAVSRALGMTSQAIFNRSMMVAITRPKSVGTKWVKQQVGA
ncbi:citrate (Si)-synthase [candidate division KSB1 bacterium]